MLIVARQVFHYRSKPIMTYRNWVKSSIGEMHYHLKDNSKFTHTIECLQNVIFYEMDLEVLDAHVLTAISSPSGTNHLVLEYKQQLRTKIASQSAPEFMMDLT